MTKKKGTKVKQDNRKVRFSGAPWAHSHQHLIIGGVGGIGSWVAFFLARIGHTLHIYDMDTIDTTNMGGQLYKESHVGVLKAEAISEIIKEFSGKDANVFINSTYDKDSQTSPIVFSCFDNMATRKLMFEKWAKQDSRELFIDGRLLAEVGMVFTVQKGQEEAYRKELFDDSEVDEVDCSFKATSHAGAYIGSIMTNSLNSYLSNKALEFDGRELPFRRDFVFPTSMDWVTNPK